MSELFDRYGRKIETLRISLTDRCNLRCLYCAPAESVALSQRSELLSFEEIIELAKYFIEIGVDKIKLTGGEPLLRKDVTDLVQSLSGLRGLKDLTLTTNGILLPLYAESLKKAGLRRINVSLDTLQERKFEMLTGRDKITDVLAGIGLALNLGFDPVKINVVLLRGINDDEIIDFVNLTRKQELIPRFIELMSSHNRLQNWNKHFIGRNEILDRIRESGDVIYEEEGVTGCGPAKYFKIRGYQGCFGIISPVSHPFCQECDRLRITAKGELIPCLHHNLSFNLKYLLRNSSKKEFTYFLRNIVLKKPAGHHLDLSNADSPLRAMCQIGG